MKYFFTFMFVSIAAIPAYGEDSTAVTRVRLTETSITETGRVSGLYPVKIKTKGYGLTYIHQSRVGLSYTFLASKGGGKISDIAHTIDLRHNYIDATFTYGSRFILTGGIGLGVSGTGSLVSDTVAVRNADWQESKSINLGPGFSIGWFEIYWIHRRNWASFKVAGEKRVLPSSHYMLGLGGHW